MARTTLQGFPPGWHVVAVTRDDVTHVECRKEFACHYGELPYQGDFAQVLLIVSSGGFNYTSYYKTCPDPGCRSLMGPAHHHTNTTGFEGVRFSINGPLGSHYGIFEEFHEVVVLARRYLESL